MSERRWAFMSRKVIGAQDNPMLIRWRLLQTPWFGLYLHFIHREDLDRLPHDHPWTFWTWVIRGEYREEFWPDARLIGNPYVAPWHQRRWRGMFRHFPRGAAHRITWVSPHVTTLVLVGPKCRTWGFYDGMGNFIDWRDYHEPAGGWSDQQKRELGLTA